MYKPVVIDSDNSKCFLPDLDPDSADLWIGAVDEESGTAGGILWADYIDEDGTLSLSVSCFLDHSYGEGLNLKTSVNPAFMAGFLYYRSDLMHFDYQMSSDRKL